MPTVLAPENIPAMQVLAMEYAGMFIQVGILTSHLLAHFSELQVPSIQAALKGKLLAYYLVGNNQKMESREFIMLYVSKKSNRSGSRL